MIVAVQADLVPSVGKRTHDLGVLFDQSSHDEECGACLIPRKRPEKHAGASLDVIRRVTGHAIRALEIETHEESASFTRRFRFSHVSTLRHLSRSPMSRLGTCGPLNG